MVKDMYTGSADLCSLQATVIAVIPEKEECLGTTFLSSFQDKLGCHQLSKFLRYFSHLGSFSVASTMYRDEFCIFVLPYDLMGFFGAGERLVNVSLSFVSS